MAWIDELAEALGVQPLNAADSDALLRTAGDVAHRVERKVTPLSTFLLGVAVGRGAAVEDVRAKLDVLLPPES
jgi:hypothetical protein